MRDVLDYAKHRERVLTGALKLGAIPSIAPYLLSAALPGLQRRSPNLTLHLRETITETLVRELVSGDLDLILVALPIEGHEIETQSLFGDKFVLAACASKGKRAKAADMLAHERLLLLEEGHRLRSGVVLLPTGDAGGARELRCVDPRHHRAEGAHSYGIILLPEIRRSDIRLLHFPAPEPKREIGLAWRKTSPRKADFQALRGC